MINSFYNISIMSKLIIETIIKENLTNLYSLKHSLSLYMKLQSLSRTVDHHYELLYTITDNKLPKYIHNLEKILIQ